MGAALTPRTEGVGETTFAYTVPGFPASPATGQVSVQQTTDHGHLGWEWHQPADGGPAALRGAHADRDGAHGRSFAEHRENLSALGDRQSVHVHDDMNFYA